MEFSSIGCPITGGCAGYFSRPRRSLLLDSPLVIMMQAPMVQKLIFGEMGGQAARSLKKPRKYTRFPLCSVTIELWRMLSGALRRHTGPQPWLLASGTGI